MEKIIEVKGVYKLYGNDKNQALKLGKEGKDKAEIHKKTGVTTALWDINLDINQGEIFVIIGLSGSGKSTLVRCFNLLNKPTYGEILFKGNNISKMSKKEIYDFKRNNISMVFQNFGLLSHRNVIGNVEFGLEIRGMSKEERYNKAMEMINLVGLEGFENSPIDNLSGGMKQRVGLARALANDPDILLMDEPFSALDPLVRKDLQFELMKIQRKLNKTIIFITHDINEAFKLGDRVAIMKDGKIIQIATPEEMTTNPANEYVRNFIENADRKKIISVKNIMITPSSIVKIHDTPSFAITTMRNNSVSSAYVVSEKMKFMGILNIESAIEAKKQNLKIEDVIEKNVSKTGADSLVKDIIDTAIVTRYPIAVVDDDEILMGIVTKADVLSAV
ncbi:quaternary amine ABC transporter ATP-binding protein [Peptostreptococcus canis]|uniref:Quaternary amine transport ATP-binding protein n=1 Tax=Peptostreptococcus canis TaxID=1159213 RepID=A0ABR6TIR6_9FIRM|nr:glycine betaine/L-proline ABC transporter ATP-binding protein [Peptostreptococcus canis]MBC2575311.1 glycine betaine/L-proline ABC transporter ATP-binding protein [Peptostreptococcus canis]MBP1997506.1 glycine betaine/proline transport system ATP-binding protein [Peptostreptococcus canis]